MTESEAIAKVKVYCAPDVHPKLTDTEIQSVLMNYVLTDGGFDLEGVMRATADAWDLKTNKASDHHAVSINGRNFSADQVKAHCEERAKFYRRRLPVHVA